MSTLHSPSAQVVRQAIDWSLRLRQPEVDPHLYEQCTQWRSAHADHEQAWQRVQTLSSDLNSTFDALPGAGQTFETLENSARQLSRRRTLKLLSGTVLLGSAGSWLARDYPAWNADFSTGIGQCQSYRLADGSQLQLNTDSVASLAGPGQLQLERGELLLDCTTPVSVAGRHGHFEAQAGRFVIRQEASRSRVSVLQGKLSIHGVGGPVTQVAAGQHYWVDTKGVQRLAELDMEAGAWAQGLIVTRNMRLADFLAELGRYRRGYLGCTDDIAGLRLSGVYRLADTDQLLAMLPKTLPVQLNYRTRWWITLQRQV
ncbi:DUF4880 domain-containing protein [Pseudomonas sp. LJDD11]|uniref:DUF4880 domain-containing protein n=1 Tax=Pseudomonas sp. LJDD11 TaxID=2931984 RepID=UPI00211CBEFC|nr:DUF4880 domain-containing protein [Pseudomonas sp. LJDD11]